jgi:hypothetical protein
MIYLSIPFSATHPREVAKRTGAKWNPSTKQWAIEAENENEISPKLRPYIVANSAPEAAPKATNQVDQTKVFGTMDWLMSGMNAE